MKETAHYVCWHCTGQWDTDITIDEKGVNISGPAHCPWCGSTNIDHIKEPI